MDMYGGYAPLRSCAHALDLDTPGWILDIRDVRDVRDVRYAICFRDVR
jgi:hypothetical protein